MKFSKSNQSGFTLVEIAIVLVIIGLLLGGVLKGQELIENSRIKSIVTAINGVSSAFNAYQDRYQAVPGTELLATTQARGWATTVGGAGNGVLAIAPGLTFTNGGNQQAMWQDLISAGFSTGAMPQATNPPLATGGLIGVSVNPYAMVGPAAICVSGLTTRQAAGADLIIDGAGSANNTGDFRGANGAAPALAPTVAAPAAAAYNEVTVVNKWSMCRSL